MAQRVIILGAAGRDFHNFNVVFRDDPAYEVVAFTATQIPNIAGRRYPPVLAGPRYPNGIPIEPEADLSDLITRHQAGIVVFSYSDVSDAYVMQRATVALAAGADFWLLGPRRTMLKAPVPVIAVCAARTGAGKSQTSRRVVALLRAAGERPVVVRHPMPYGDLAAQAVQRFATREDLDQANVTLEEREEYEPHLEAGVVVYAGVDYARILAAAQAEATVLVWDGGNNDLPFFVPDLHITVADPQRAAHMRSYYPGAVNVRLADVVVLNKVDSAAPEEIEEARRIIAEDNPTAVVVEAESPLIVDEPEQLRGKQVVVVEDGPTLTHGELAYGAGLLAARRYGATPVDPRPYAVGALRQAYQDYPHMGPVLPALGYGAGQLEDLAASLSRTPADLIVSATPVDLSRLLKSDKPIVRVRYELRETAAPARQPTLQAVIADFVERRKDKP
ncbi:MAG TPA: cyclic 2,3-diphosphoglycerate synthase [Caldilineaceae bacterium]|nr:cyclic 2,3-diphosphoglycerate synthase [Caldilineaceae bacterium]